MKVHDDIRKKAAADRRSIEEHSRRLPAGEQLRDIYVRLVILEQTCDRMMQLIERLDRFNQVGVESLTKAQRAAAVKIKTRPLAARVNWVVRCDAAGPARPKVPSRRRGAGGTVTIH
jgi:hypothetical protein